MCDEVISYLRVGPGKSYLDCTVGGGGHSEAILEKSSPDGRLFGLDRDQTALTQADERLREKYQGRYFFYHSDFRHVSQVIHSERKGTFHGILADLGVSTLQLENPDRGFSFQKSGPLDMRMDPSQPLQARDLVESLSQEELSGLIERYGEERYAGRIARSIVREREKSPIMTTGQLSELIKKSVPSQYRYGRIHPATRTFQALRIAVNRELDLLSEFIREIFQYLAIGGRLAIISFHSLEDRIVKRTFLDLVQKRKKDPLFQWTKKPVSPGESEVKVNPASRSAKMRVIERRA
ncbi:MAG: 16S rRNA (cytosine(1402)-N(4))-methyltransferase RsmH [Nitrospirae bacterium]|nr:16S rRNA (cytosine(1402)-N(4))-methyltransferase RsmH [Nitrospirota bacterium]MBI3593857.1 16S rRNA (cytosine(1402)-N(4))-methyltransferase RsmH [Nitrospirota bacterium]